MSFELNVVRVAEDTDFLTFRQLCDEHEGWTLVHSKKDFQAWTKMEPGIDFQKMKVRTIFQDIAAPVLYDVLHDPEYRKTWDKYMYEGKDIGHLNPNNDLSYYCLRSPPPFRGRDFVLQRCWLEAHAESMIFNHSVCHDDYPPRKGVVRAISYITGYLVRPLGNGGCQVTYVTHSNPGGKLPSWVVNKLTTFVAPKVMKRLHKAASQYTAWKAKHNPSYKPWLYPEQISSPRIALAKCVPRNYTQDDLLDESKLADVAQNDDNDI